MSDEELEYFSLEDSEEMKSEGDRIDSTRKATYKFLPFIEEDEPEVRTEDIPEEADFTKKDEEEKEIACYIICPSFPPHKLSEGKEFTIGRDMLNHFVVPSMDVSRFHAVIKWNLDHYLISDLGSSNGTIVNQVPIDTSSLEHGDRILIGNTLMTYQEIEIGTFPKVFSSKETQQVGANKRWMELNKEILREQSEATGSLSGNLETMSLASIMQLLGIDEKSGCLQVISGAQRAFIYLVNGEVVHSEAGEFSGQAAFMEAMRWKYGKFEFVDKSPNTVTMSCKVEWLLFEAARILDEEAKQ